MQTDALTHQGDVLLDVATVLEGGEAAGEAADRVRQAIDAYDRKQNVAAARTPARDWPERRSSRRAESPYGPSARACVDLRASATAEVRKRQRRRDARQHDDELLADHLLASLPALASI